jgi:hypothetical protein
MTQDSIMKFETTLPEDFTGVFTFTNWTDEDFTGVWGKKEYLFPANSSSPMIIPEHSPLEIQHIRKKFAKDLAEREFFKSKKYEAFRAPEGTLGNRSLNSIHMANSYSIDDLVGNIQKCLVSLPVKKASVSVATGTPLEDKLSRDEEGNINTRVVSKNESLREKALAGKGLND